MSIYDLIQRTQIILKKYEKYDAPIKTKNNKSDDPFMEEYQEVEAELDKVLEAVTDVACEQNRALIASKNAEIRRAKTVLLTEAITALEKKVKKGKGVSKQVIADRQEKIKDLIERIYAVPDGRTMAVNRRPARTYVKGKKGEAVYINGDLDSNPANQDGYYAHTEMTQNFEKEWEEAKKKQDEKLGMIGDAVDGLADMARNFGSELDRQAPIIDDIEQQMDKVTKSLKTNNAKLKGMVAKMRSSRNFCVDIILIVVLLAIGAYIYAMFM
ncbi:hypothetical protein VaNZ11_012251 [Volvox africanus]|uniref:t-SNARE coiled-coil homology domain-containing protein n=1 Tax=Volvox africanus TaxID=51714 RepID=A0ABQ5SEQ0_9CHLO|nr:hypothetical protein VaNZ11_012251 [Volvox africanus]